MLKTSTLAPINTSIRKKELYFLLFVNRRGNRATMADGNVLGFRSSIIFDSFFSSCLKKRIFVHAANE
jgi:hypothetical protein